MGAWLLFGTPGGNSPNPGPQLVGDWRLIPASEADAARCRFEGGWAALEYQGESDFRIEDLRVQPGDRWEFEDGWEAANMQWALAGEPVPGSPQEDMSQVDLAERMQDAPANWSHGGRTGCVFSSGTPQEPPG
jgi:hypothetical protein